MDEKVVDVECINLDNRDYFSMEEVTELLKVDTVQLTYWCNKFEKLLKIKSIGMFLIFNREDIRNLRVIKEMNIDKGLTIKEVQEFLSQHSTTLVVKKENELENSIFGFFSNIVTTQNQKIDGLLESQNKFMETFSKMYSENNSLSTFSLENPNTQAVYNENFEKKIEDILTASNEKLDRIENEFKKRDMAQIALEKQKMEAKHIMYEIEKEKRNNKFFNKLFKK